LGEKDTATQELSKHLAVCCSASDRSWQANIARFLIGELSEAEFLKASEIPDNLKIEQQRAEACFYAGEKRLINGDSKAAAGFFQECMAFSRKDSSIGQAAKAELGFLSRFE
jgi:lipoprotein NlpI